jgi:hypothetical protein
MRPMIARHEAHFRAAAVKEEGKSYDEKCRHMEEGVGVCTYRTAEAVRIS